MALQYFNDPAWESMALIEAEQQRRKAQQTRLAVTPEMAQRAVDMSFLYPQLSGGVVASAAVAGLDPMGPEMQQIAGRSLEVDAMNTYVPALDMPDAEQDPDNLLKKGIRSIFMGFDLLYEDGVKGASRFIQGLIDGVGFDENVSRSFGFSGTAMHIAAGRAGVHSNMGTGFLPDSNIADETLARLEQGADIWEAINNPEQLEMGIPSSLIQRQRVQDPTSANTMFNSEGQHFAVSPGRLLANTIMEPGSVPFGIFSGIADVASNIFLDPSNALGGFVGDARAATRVLRPNGVRQTVVSGAETWLNRVGIQGGGAFTRDVRDYARTADDWLMSRHGQNITQFLAQNEDFLTTYEMLASSKRGLTPNVGLARSITDATDAGDVANLIRDAVNKGELNHIIGRQSMLGRAIGSSGIVGAFSRDGSMLDVAGVRQSIRRNYLDSSVMGAWAAEIGGSNVISTMDIDQSTFALGEWMKVARFEANEISEAMGRMARVQPGQWDEAFNVVRDVNLSLASRLEAQGMPAPVVHHFRRVLDDVADQRRFFIDQTGQPVPFAGAKFDVYGDGTPHEIASAQLISEMISHTIPLIDHRAVRSATRRSRVAELLGTDAATGQGKWGLLRRHIENFDDLGPGALTKISDAFMQGLWKPMTLLRPAWTARVVGDEQMRMAAAPGISSIFNHPIHAIAIAMGRRHGSDVLGEAFENRRSVSNVREWLDGVVEYETAEMAAAMSRRGGHQAGRTTRVRFARDYILQRKGLDTRYNQGWAIQLRNLSSDPIAARVARGLADSNNVTGRADFGLADLKQSFWDGELSQYREMLITDGGQNAQLAQRVVADSYIDGIAARIVHVTGGKVEWQNFDDGDWYDMYRRIVSPGSGGRQIPRRLPKTSIDPATGMNWQGKSGGGGEIWAHGVVRYRNQSLGSVELLEAIATGELGPNRIRLAGHFGDEIVESGAVDRVAEELAQIKDGGISIVDMWGPEHVAVARELDPGAGAHFDKAVDNMFNMLMSRPSNYLSRSPAFRQFYWKRVTEMMPALDEATQATVLANGAESLGRKSAEFRALQRAAKMGREGHITDAETLDTVAKAFALEETQGLLYDVSRRRNFFDITRNIFPFGEAWLEIATTWSRLLMDNPALIRRVQQGIQGARNTGMFYSDPDTGEEVYAFPGTPTMMAALFRDNNTQDGLRATPVFSARASGLNLALNGFLPGVGPMVQIPAASFLEGFVSDPDMAWLQDYIFPFGQPDIGSPAAVTDMVIPAWARKAFIALGSPSGVDQRVFNNTVTDVLKTMETNGEIDMSTQHGINEAMELAKRRARQIYAVRAFSQFLGPVGAQVRFEVQYDDDGNMLEQIDRAEGITDEQKAELASILAARPEAITFLALGEEYQAIRDRNGGNDAAAYDEFIRRFGVEPLTFATGKSLEIVPRSVTDPGLEFEARNPELFAEFPLTAYFVRPDGPDEDFSGNAYANQLREGTREALDPDEWLRRRNDLLGRLQYQAAKDRFGPMVNHPLARSALNALRMDLMDQYPGYGYSNFGVSSRADPDAVRDEFRDWFNEPELMKTSAGQGLATYLQVRDRVVQQSIATFGVTEQGFATADATFAQRQYLRQFAMQMLADERYVDFAPIFQRYFQRELEGNEVQPPAPPVGTLQP